MEQLGTIAGFVLTLMVFSYLLGDNFLYRLAVYVFVGIAAGYVAIVTVEGVIAPLLLSNNAAEIILLLISVALAFTLVFRISAYVGWVGKLTLAFVIGVGTAVALAGALTGTLLPLTLETGRAPQGDLFNGAIALIGTATSLIYFQYLARRRPDGAVTNRRLNVVLRRIGEGFIVVTLGALYGGAILTSLTILSERITYLIAGG
ncbi:MAG: hypothetical protein D6712_04425 [Chloroflexi bacterium]|nr:MAG: hypothetical protein D6712_04425 [Chloroflexota bacterium]